MFVYLHWVEEGQGRSFFKHHKVLISINRISARVILTMLSIINVMHVMLIEKLTNH